LPKNGFFGGDMLFFHKSDGFVFYFAEIAVFLRRLIHIIINIEISAVIELRI
jgi:hypothetical protein